MTLYDLVNNCACKLDAIEIRVNDGDFGDDMTINTYTYPELLAREGAGARTKAVKRWWFSDTFEHVHGDDIRLVKRVLVVVIWG